MKPIVTVLTTVYNGKNYLNEAIESVLCQTLTNYEFLIVDDASTDNSIEIINSYNDSRIKLLINKKILVKLFHSIRGWRWLKVNI